MKIHAVLVAAGLGFVPLVAIAQDTAHAIMAAPAGTTTFQAAEDITKIAGTCGLNFVAVESQGSLENLLAVDERPFTPVAIVQGDFLEYLRTFAADDPKMANKIANIGIVAPLFSQEVHVIVGGEIFALADLSGEKIAIGEAESGSFLTARVILDLLGIVPSEFVQSPPAEALTKLQAGEIAAVFLVDGAPSELLVNAGLDPEKFRLLPMDVPVLAAAYAQATIPPGTYEIAPEETLVVTVPSVMIGYNFAAESARDYAKANCAAVVGIAAVLDQHGAELVASGHPKWAELNPSLPVEDWTRTVCAEKGFSPEFVLPCPGP